MSFRKFGGLQFASKHNIVSSNYNTSNNLLVTQNVGQPNSYINFLSDISGNILVYGDFDLSGNLYVSGNIDCSKNITSEYMFLSSGINYTTSPNGVVPKSYIDAIATGLSPLPFCIVCENVNVLSLSGYPMIDGIQLNASFDGSAVLINAQGGQNIPNINNGVYIVSSGAWSRSSYLSNGDNATGTITTILNGTIYAYYRFVCTSGTSINPAVIGTDPVLWSGFDIPFSFGEGLIKVSTLNNTVIQVDPSLNFLTQLDNSGNTLNIGAYTNTLNIGSSSTNINFKNGFNVNGNATISGTLGVTGNTSLSTLSATGLLSAQGGITGATGSFTYLSSSNGINISGGINVSGLISARGGITGATGSFTNTLISGPEIVTGLLSARGGLTGATGSFTNTLINGNEIVTGLLSARGGLTGATGSFTNTLINGNEIVTGLLSARGGITGATGSFDNITVTKLLSAPGGLTGTTGSFTNTIISGSEIITGLLSATGGITGTTGSFSNTIISGPEIITGLLSARGGITGATGSFNNLYVTTKADFLQDISVNSINIGRGSGNGNTNTVVGINSLIVNNNGLSNTAIGYECLKAHLSGSNNTAIGSVSLQDDISGNDNTALGYGSLRNNIYGTFNTAIGSRSLNSNTNGSNNTAIGYDSLLYHTSSSLQTAVGYLAGNNDKLGNNNTYLGAETNVDSSANNYTHSTALGYGTIIDASNQIVFGTDTEKIKIPGTYVGIGGVYDPTNNYTLDVSGNALFTGDITFNNASFTSGLVDDLTITASLAGTTPFGTSFQKLTAGTSSDYNFISVAAAPFDSSGNTIIVGVTNSGYIYPYVNSGATFGSGGYIYVSFDSGLTFTKQTSIPIKTWSSICMTVDLSNNAYITAVTTGLNGATDNTYTTTFSTLPLPVPSSIPWTAHQLKDTSSSYKVSMTGVSMTNNGEIQVIVAGDNQNWQQFRSTDYGSTWTRINSDTNDSRYAGGIVVQPNITTTNFYDLTNYSAFFTYKIGFYIKKSINGGQSYPTTVFNNYENAIACSDNGTYVTTVGPSSTNNTPSVGIAISSNNGQKWTSNPGGFITGSYKFLGISMSPSGKYQIIADYTVGAVFISSNFGNNWTLLNTFNINFTWIIIDKNIDSTGLLSFTASAATGAIDGGIYQFSSTINVLNIITPVVISGSCSASSFITTSDYRIKENVLPLTTSMYSVDNLRPVLYNNILTKKQDIGVIAHELQTEFSFLVEGVKDGKDLQCVNYIGLIGLLITEIQELKNEIKIIKNHLYKN